MATNSQEYSSSPAYPKDAQIPSKKKKPSFSFSDGKRVKGISAQDLGEYLLDLKKKLGGVLNASDVVDNARAPSSTIHHLFEWNDKKAAEMHRESRARDLMRSVVVYMPCGPKKTQEPIRILVHVETDSKQGYIGIKSAMTDKESAAYVVRTALRELRYWRKKYGAYRELTKVCAAIDNALK